MASRAVPKSIFKPPKRPSPSSSASKEERDRQTAIYHAEIIQQRKDLELFILNSIEALIDFPSPATVDPADPHHDDASTVRSLLIPFQPSDYDDLVQERNIEGKCGYVLCPHARLLQDTKAQFRILRVGKQEGGLKIVPREHLEKWCSEACQRRAMYVRVQLSEEPAWIREAMATEIVFLDEVESKQNAQAGDQQIGQLAKEMGKVEIGGAQTRQKKELAKERGEEGVEGKVVVTIKENYGSQKVGAPAPPSLADGKHSNIQHLLLEGHLPKGQSTRDTEHAGNQEHYDNDNDREI
jgi:RNA polymerase II-associated protein 2